MSSMKLKEFNAENTISTRTSAPVIGMNLKNGLFNINREVCDLIGLGDGDSVVFHQDQEDEQNWYLEKVKEKGFSVRKKENVTKGVIFNNTTLARAIAKSVAFEGASGRLLVAGKFTEFQRRKLWGIITTSLRNK
jgi:hypothetical protein